VDELRRLSFPLKQDAQERWSLLLKMYGR